MGVREGGCGSAVGVPAGGWETEIRKILERQLCSLYDG